jgi:hypothetical protein
MIRIILENAGGELDSRIVGSFCVREAIFDIVSGIDEFFPGDKIFVLGDED